MTTRQANSLRKTINLLAAEIRSVEVVVRANADADDCLSDAAESYIADHPELRGYDLAPRWTDEDDRETVTLTVPDWAVQS